MLSRIKIKIDGKPVAKIRQNQEIELELPNDNAKIIVSQFDAHSNELLVKDGQVVEITTSPWSYVFLISVFITLLLIFFFLPRNYQKLGYIVVLIISIAFNYFKDTFKLKVISP